MIASGGLPTDNLLVLLPRRRPAVLERPHMVFKLQHEQPIVLAGCPQGSVLCVKVNRGVAPVGAALAPLPEGDVVGARAWRRRAGRVEVRDLPHVAGMADVENANPGVEVTAHERRRMVLIVDTTVRAGPDPLCAV